MALKSNHPYYPKETLPDPINLSGPILTCLNLIWNWTYVNPTRLTLIYLTSFKPSKPNLNFCFTQPNFI